MLHLDRRYRLSDTKLHCCDLTDKQHWEKPTLSNMEIKPVLTVLTASRSLRERLQAVYEVTVHQLDATVAWIWIIAEE